MKFSSFVQQSLCVLCFVAVIPLVIEIRFFLCGLDLLDGAALLRADEGIRRDGGEVAVPCGRSVDDAGGGIAHPALHLGVVGIVEADEAVGVDRGRDLCALAHIGVGGLRHLERTVLADDFAVDVIAELAVDEDLIVDADTALRAQEHDLRILQMCCRCARDAREKHLCGDEVVVDEPVNDVDLVNRRVVHRHLGGVAVGHERDAARARPDAILVEQGADGEVLRVVQMNDEDLLAVRLREILKARTHAVEMEAVDVRPTLSLSTS